MASMRELFYRNIHNVYGTDAPRILSHGAADDLRNVVSTGITNLGIKTDSKTLQAIGGFLSPVAQFLGLADSSPSVQAQLMSVTGKVGIKIDKPTEYNAFAHPRPRQIDVKDKIRDGIVDAFIGPGPLDSRLKLGLSKTVSILKKEGTQRIFDSLKQSAVGRPDIQNVWINRERTDLVLKPPVLDTRWQRLWGNQSYHKIMIEGGAMTDGSTVSPLTTEHLYNDDVSPYITVQSINSKLKPVRRDEFVDNLEYSKKTFGTPLGTENVADESLENKRGMYSHGDVLNQLPVKTNSELSRIRYKGKTLDEADLIPFSFEDIKNQKKVYFRCTVNSFNESFNPRWESTKYIGRPFNFYLYDGMERQASLSFTIFSLNAIEHFNAWEKLNYLVGLTYPVGYDLTSNTDFEQADSYHLRTGYMIPPIIRVTYGSIFKNNFALINSLTYTIPPESTWEVGGGTRTKKTSTVIMDGLDPYTNTPNQTETRTDVGLGYSPSDDYNRDDSYEPEFVNNTATMDDYKLPHLINVDVSLTILQNGFPGVSSKHFGFNPISQGS